MLMCASYAFGQGNGVPQWKVVKQFHVANQSETIPPTPIFTPQKDGMYRVDLYAAGVTAVDQNTAWDIGVAWTDASAGIAVPYIFRIDLLNGSFVAGVPPVT